MARRISLQRSVALASCALATALASACPPPELRVIVEDLSTAAAECASASGNVENCGPDVDTNRFIESEDGELRIRDDACVAARLAVVARPSEPGGSWPAERRMSSPCVELERGVSVTVALAKAVDQSLVGGLTVEDVESAEDAVFVLGLFGSASTECDCGEANTLFACSRLGPDSDDSSTFGVACTQCSGRTVTGNDFATCSPFADARCFFEGCITVLEDP